MSVGWSVVRLYETITFRVSDSNLSLPKTYLTTYLCDSSDSCEICDSSDRSGTKQKKIPTKNVFSNKICNLKKIPKKTQNVTKLKM